MAVTKIDEATYQEPMQDMLKCFTNCCLTYPGVVIGTGSAAKAKITNSITYVIDGKIYYHATASDEIALTGEAQATATACIYLISINKDGTLACTQGDIVASTATPEVPTLPDASAPIGYVKVVNATGSNFTPGSTGLDTSNITDIYTDLFSMATAT